MGGNSRTEFETGAVHDYQSPQWGAIETTEKLAQEIGVSIPAMGGNRTNTDRQKFFGYINPRNGGQ